MTTYFMFGKYPIDTRGQNKSPVSSGAAAVIGDCGGKLESGYSLLGEKDLVLMAEFPSTAAAMKASIKS